MSYQQMVYFSLARFEQTTFALQQLQKKDEPLKSEPSTQKEKKKAVTLAVT